jgi:hypothetical protein
MTTFCQLPRQVFYEVSAEEALTQLSCRFMLGHIPLR